MVYDVEEVGRKPERKLPKSHDYTLVNPAGRVIILELLHLHHGGSICRFWPRVHSACRIIVAFFPRGLTREEGGLPSLTYSRVKARSDRILAGHAYGSKPRCVLCETCSRGRLWGSSGYSWSLQTT